MRWYRDFAIINRTRYCESTIFADRGRLLRRAKSRGGRVAFVRVRKIIVRDHEGLAMESTGGSGGLARAAVYLWV